MKYMNKKATNQDGKGSPQNSSQANKQAATFSRLLSRQEVARRWGCCPHTIARRKGLRPLRLNRRLLRYRIEDVQAVETAAAA